MRNPRVSLFASSTNTNPIATVSLSTILDHIRTGTYSQHVLWVRQQRTTKGEDAYREAKKGLKALTPAGTFSRRANTKLLTASGLAHYDLDGVGHVAQAKALLAQDQHVVYAFTSPSGDGIKFAVWTDGIMDNTTYKHAWQTVLAYLQGRYPALAVNTDRGCKDVARLCYVSFDPALYSNPDAVRFDVPPHVPPTPRSAPQRMFSPRSDEQARVEVALRHIPSDARETWLTVGMALHSSAEPWARNLWDAWSQTSSKFTECGQEAAWRSFKPDGGVGMGTIFHEAEQYGYRPVRHTNGTRNGQAVLGISPAKAKIPMRIATTVCTTIRSTLA
jgi:hypothetical protein